MKTDTAGQNEAVELTGGELNERLDEQMLAIERTSIMLEDAKLDANDLLMLDRDRLDRLMELLSAYESFLEHFRKTTEDTVAAIKGLTTVSDSRYCASSDDDDADIDDDAGDWPG